MVTMNCRAESRDEPAGKIRFLSRLAGIVRSLRTANRDRRLLPALDDRMLGDIGLAREHVLHGVRVRTSGNSQATALRISVLTIFVVLVSLAVALVAPDTSKVDPLRFASCAWFPQGIMGGSNRWVMNRRCNPPYGGCRQIAGAPKHVC